MLGSPLLLLAVMPLASGAKPCEGRACSCVGLEYGRPMIKYEEAVACIFINGQKAIFYPRVDEYAVLEVQAVDAMSSQNASQIWIGVEGHSSTGQNSKLAWVPHDKPWSTSGNIAPFYTVIVRMNMGVIERVQWDSHCSTCSSANADTCLSDRTEARCSTMEPPLDQCYDCYIPRSQCLKKEQCVPRVYVAWLGTDARGNPCTSAGKVISRFRGSSLSGLYDSGSQSSVTLTPVGGQPVPQGASGVPTDSNAGSSGSTGSGSTGGGSSSGGTTADPPADESVTTASAEPRTPRSTPTPSDSESESNVQEPLPPAAAIEA